MLERKRIARGYRSVPGDEEIGVAEGGEDVELDEGMGVIPTGITTTVTGADGGTVDLDGELDRWDENAEDNWDDQPEDQVEEDAAAAAAAPTNGRAKEPLPPPPDEGMRLSLDTDLKAKT